MFLLLSVSVWQLVERPVMCSWRRVLSLWIWSAAFTVSPHFPPGFTFRASVPSSGTHQNTLFKHMWPCQEVVTRHWKFYVYKTTRRRLISITIMPPNELKPHPDAQVVPSLSALLPEWMEACHRLVMISSADWRVSVLIYSLRRVTDHEPAGLAQPLLPRASPRTLHNLVTGHSGEQHASARQQIKRDIFRNPCRPFQSVIYSLVWDFFKLRLWLFSFVPCTLFCLVISLCWFDWWLVSKTLKGLQLNQYFSS